MQPIKSKRGMLLTFLNGSKRYFLLAIVFGLLRTVCAMLNPQLVQFTVDSVIGDKEAAGAIGEVLAKLFDRDLLRSHLYLIALIVIGLAIANSLCRYVFILSNAKGGEGFVRTMRNGTFHHIERLPFSWHMEHQTGDIIQRCTTDIEMVKTFLSEQLSNLINCVITLVAAIIFMFSVNVKLSAIILATQPLLLLFTVYFRGKITSQFRKCDEMEGELSTIAQENLTGVRVVRAFGREAYEQERFDKQSSILTRAWIKMGVHMSSFWEVSGLLSAIQGMIVLVVGTVMVVHGEMTTGALMAMITYNATASEPIRMLGRIVSEMGKAGVSIERLFEIMSAPEEQDPPDATTPDMTGDIVFEHVNFNYPGHPQLLQDVSFTVKAGTTLGILGGTGSGKSTLMYLLERLYDLPPEHGRITIGGQDIAGMRANWVRKNVGMVLQEPMLFSRTLSENIGMATDNATLSDIRAAARAAYLEDAIDSFSEGYDTVVGERGVTLSGGQKQRAAIARMLLQKTPIMVFDDSLSAVDAETDAKIRAALRTQMAGATCILISHRISTLMEADQILVLEQGRIAEQGTHTELIRQGGLYRRIYDLQLQCAEEVAGHAE